MKIYNLIFLGILLGLTAMANTSDSDSYSGSGSGRESERSIASGVPANLDAKNESEVVQKIRSRSYRGGSDESDLKVQNQLLKPTRKIAPTVEDESEPASDE
ncbi:MAG: hypothetical protein JNM39_10445 [Bdellovibrionaceae bacterium]|nr:hypothetical protein [Pseudobdellovibrionaceae bacterium]